ncbi:unnamed protein product [Penicillium bialowiezense]
MATTKALPSSALLVSGKVRRGLDPFGNPDISFCTTNTQRALANFTPVRNVEWLRPPPSVLTHNHVYSRRKFTSVLGQRSDMRVPTGKECTTCIQRPGPLKGCVIHNGITATPTGLPMGRGACMNCIFRGDGHFCSLRSPESCKDLWYTQYLFPKFLNQRRATQNGKLIELSPGNQATLSLNQHTNKGPSYPEKWYQTPLDNAALAKKPDEMRLVLKELRRVRARIEWDIRKLSRFVGSDDVEGKGLGNPNAFHEAGSVDDSITPADGNSVEIGTLAIDSPGWNSSGHDFDGDDVDGDDFDGDDFDGDDFDGDDIDDEVYEEDSVEIDSDAVSGN